MKTYSSILRNTDKMKYFTDMRVIFDALDGKQKNYNWLVSDIELNLYPDASWYDEPFIWISGSELTDFVYKNQLQYRWAVFSGFKENIRIDANNLTNLPFAEGNSGFWRDEPKIQHPLAELEIVCWDSSLTLFLSKDPGLARKFGSYFKEAQDLSTYNMS